MPKNEKGFSLPEIIIALGIAIILFGFVGLNLFKTQHTVALSSSLEPLLVDLANQQTKAMTGNTEGRASSDSYGVYLGSTNYTLFHGSLYNPSDLSNFTVNLEQNIQFGTITFPSRVVIFSSGSGEIAGFTNGSNTFVIKNILGNEQKTVTLNRYGVITSVQ